MTRLIPLLLLLAPAAVASEIHDAAEVVGAREAYRQDRLSLTLSDDDRSIRGSWNDGKLDPAIGWGYIRRPGSQ